MVNCVIFTYLIIPALNHMFIHLDNIAKRAFCILDNVLMTKVMVGGKKYLHFSSSNLFIRLNTGVIKSLALLAWIKASV